MRLQYLYMYKGAKAAMQKNRSNTWRPILEGSLHDRAIDAVRAISDDVLTIGLKEDSENADPLLKNDDSYSLSSGKAGMALFYAYLSELQSKEKNRDAAIFLLEQAVDAFSSTRMFPSLYLGFTGVAWAAEHIQSRLGDSDEEDLNESIDEALMEWLDRPIWSEDYNLIRGLAGFGVYAVERAHKPSAVQCLERIVALLDENCERKPEGITWHTSPDLLPDHQRAECPNGYYNLGLAHGIPGLIALLGETYAAGVSVDRTWPLLEGAVRWLLAQKMTAQGEEFFPNRIAAEIEPSPSRLAWCYGDLGLSAAVMCAARLADEPSWEREALDIALRSANFSMERARVNDAALCHGAAGNAHIFNRFYQASGDERFKEAALFWFEQTLDMRSPGEGVGGFRSWKVNMATTQFGWEDDPGFLRGSVGIGLSLLAAVTSVEPDWDRVLLTSIPPR
jgi:lantibiotic biosynthesis protein